jgi:hypothetical protein
MKQAPARHLARGESRKGRRISMIVRRVSSLPETIITRTGRRKGPGAPLICRRIDALINATLDSTADYISSVARSVGKRWPLIEAARQSALEVRRLLGTACAQGLGPFSTDVDLVVFGSLARGEWTSGSDVDWTLLIDGQAIPDHRTVARSIRDIIASVSYRELPLAHPGAEGIFGSMAFSHDIIHYIGGQADTNRNTTQRILLLLEATPIQAEGQHESTGAYDRVTRAILYRYPHDDTNFAAAGPAESRIPRFLLNDIVRYWRTMCVDFAYKEWEQAGKKWALRNLKLRMSRKPLFVSALFTVFSCYRNSAIAFSPADAESYIAALQDHLQHFARSTPLNIVAWALLQLDLEDQCSQLFDCYEEFLRQIDDPETRRHLETIEAHTVYQDQAFLELRSLSHRFQEVLDQVFFAEDTFLRECVIKYGVF